MTSAISYFKSFCFLFLLYSAGASSIIGQQTKATEKPFDFEELKSRMVYRGKEFRSAVQLNKLLIAEVRRRKVDFLLTKDDEATLRRLRASDKLLQTIKQSVPELRRARLRQFAEMNQVFVRFVNNYKSPKAEEIAIAIEAGKQFVKLYAADPEVEDQLVFIRAFIPHLEKKLAIAKSKSRH